MNEEVSDKIHVPSPPAAKQTTWPKAIGIVAMIFGVLGSLGGLWAVGTSFFTEMLAKLSHLPPDSYEKWRPFMVGNGLATLFLGGLLFFGGLFLMQRKRSSSKMLNSWAILKMIVGVTCLYFNFLMQKEQMPLMMEYQKEMMEKAGAPGVEKMADMVTGMTEVMVIVGLVAGLVWLMVLPVFMLIWFIRPKIRHEVAGWGAN
jgi:hypothetical protein